MGIATDLATDPMMALLASYGERLKSLEQKVTTPGALSPGTKFTTIELGPTGSSIPLTASAPNAVGSIAVTAGAFYSVIYCDVQWTPSGTGVYAASFEVEVAKKIAGVYQNPQYFITAGTNVRVEPLEPNTQYGVRITPRSRLGVRGVTSAWNDFTTGMDSTIPGSVSNLQIARGATSAVVTFDPLDAVLNPDVAGGHGLYEVQIDTVNTFDSANRRVIRTTSWIVAFDNIVAEGNWYARVSAIDESGNQGAWTVAGPATVGGVIDSMVVAGLSAAKITVGTMSGDRITANTLDVVALKTSSLTTQTISLTGGSLTAGNPPTTGLLLNSQGMRLYNAGVETASWDAVTGTATVTGNFYAAGRVEITPTFGLALFSTTTYDEPDASNYALRWKGPLGGYIAGLVHYRMSGQPQDYILRGKAVRLFIDGVNNISVGTANNSRYTGMAMFGSLTATHVALDANEIQARNADAASTLYCNFKGGDVSLGEASDVLISRATGLTTIKFRDLVTSVSAANAVIDASGFLRQPSSSRLFKQNIVPVAEEVNIENVLKLNPVFYSPKPESGETGRWCGLIAEEVQKVLPSATTYYDDGRIRAVDYQQVSMLLLAVVQKLVKEVRSKR